MRLDESLTLDDLGPRLDAFFELAAAKVRSWFAEKGSARGSPVCTVAGRYEPRAWTEWTLGFRCGAPLLLFDAIGDTGLWVLGRDATHRSIPNQLTHRGVHDHGFTTISTFGNLWRLAFEQKAPEEETDVRTCKLALRVSGAVQASRWTPTCDNGGFIHSFNGAHSLFCDTIRSCRVTALAHGLGQVLLEEGDARINLLERTIDHLLSTLRYNVYYGEGRDAYDVAGRVAQESLFNPRNGSYRCPSTQQGYSPFTTWTRGLAWVIAGCAEQLEFFERLPDDLFPESRDRQDVVSRLERAAEATFEYYLRESATDGIPLWDTGAPGIARMAADYRTQASDPYNAFEPVDSSAAAIAAQGFHRLATYWSARGRGTLGRRAGRAALGILSTLLSPPYLSTDPEHQGLVLHSIYHRPRGWDHVPAGRAVPCGESSLWGDYHAIELALLAQRERRGEPPFSFYMTD